MASSTKKAIIDKYSQVEMAQNQIYLIVQNDIVKTWDLAEGYFFEIYAPKIKVNLIEELNEIPFNSINVNHLLVFTVSGTQVALIPQVVLQDRINAFRSTTIEYNFVSNFSSALWDQINITSTPDGHVVFPYSWQDSSGLVCSSITLVSPYDLFFPSITCEKGSKLIFSAGMPYAISDGADLSVDLERKGIEKRIFNLIANTIFGKVVS